MARVILLALLLAMPLVTGCGNHINLVIVHTTDVDAYADSIDVEATVSAETNEEK